MRTQGNVALPLVLPVGTQVVTRGVAITAGGTAQPRGAVGAVVEAPVDGAGLYLVRFLDGGVALLGRHEIAVRKHEQADGLRGAGSGTRDFDVTPFVIYRCVVGSRAYGLDEEGSDTDRRGIYLPPADLHWSLAGVPEQVENDARQEVYWEVQKFLTLALKANPNVLECLYTPLVEVATPLAEELLSLRAAFLSRLVYQTYNGYVMSQFKKLETDLRTHGAPKWKHAMHLIRLLLAGIAILHEGNVPVDVGTYRDRLLAIRRSDVPWEEVNAWRLELHGAFDLAYTATRLPERPDYERVNTYLLQARRTMV